MIAASLIPIPPPPNSSGIASPSQPPLGHPAVEVPRELVLTVTPRPVVVVEARAHLPHTLRDQLLILGEPFEAVIDHGCHHAAG